MFEVIQELESGRMTKIYVAQVYPEERVQWRNSLNYGLQLLPASP